MQLSQFFDFIESGQLVHFASVHIPDEVHFDRFRNIIKSLLLEEENIGEWLSMPGIRDHSLYVPVSLSEIRISVLREDFETLNGAPVPLGGRLHRLGGDDPTSISSMGQGLVRALWLGFSGALGDLNALLSRDVLGDVKFVDGEGQAGVSSFREQSIVDGPLKSTSVQALERGFVPASVLAPGIAGQFSLESWRSAVARHSRATDSLFSDVDISRARISRGDLPVWASEKSYRFSSKALRDAFGGARDLNDLT